MLFSMQKTLGFCFLRAVVSISMTVTLSFENGTLVDKRNTWKIFFYSWLIYLLNNSIMFHIYFVNILFISVLVVYFFVFFLVINLLNWLIYICRWSDCCLFILLFIICRLEDNRPNLDSRNNYCM